MILLSDIVDVLVCGQRSGTDAGLNTQSLCNHIVGTGGQDRRSGAATVLDIGIATEEVAVTLNLHCILTRTGKHDLAVLRLCFHVGAEVDDSTVHQLCLAQITALTSRVIIVLDALHLAEMEEILSLNHDAQRAASNLNDCTAGTDRTHAKDSALQEAARRTLVIEHAAAHLSKVTGTAVFRHIDLQHVVAVIDEIADFQVIVVETAGAAGQFLSSRNILVLLIHSIVSGGRDSLRSKALCLSGIGFVLRSGLLNGRSSVLRSGNRGGHLVDIGDGGVLHFVLVHGISLLFRT